MMRCLCFLLLINATAAVAATKDDRVAFAPGSQMVGELKRLERGRLYFKTDATDQIPIDWQKITLLVSSQQVQIELTNGTRYLGHLVTSEPAHLTIRTHTQAQIVPMADVVRITPIEETFRERWDVDLSAGYNFTKASDVRQLNFGMAVDYTTETRRVQLASELAMTNDSNNDQITQMTTSLRNLRLRQNRWITGYLATLERNDGLGLDLRTSLGVGVGRFILQTNSTNLELLGALLVSREDVQGTSASETTIEGLVSTQFELFRYAEPEIDLTTRLDVIPNLSDFGRVRAEYDLTLRWELVDDFFWELKFYDSYDTDPVSQGVEKNDYGIVTGLAWDL